MNDPGPLAHKLRRDGGPARNVGMRRALEAELGVELLVPEIPQIVTATGAAAMAAARVEKQAG